MAEDQCVYYENFYKNAPIGFYTTNLSDGSICMANPACIRMLGYKDLDDLQRNVKSMDLYPKEDREKFIQKMVKRGCVTDFETQLTVPNGKKLWVLLSGNIKGEHIQGAVVDINEKHEMKLELDNYKKEGLKAARCIGDAIEQRIDDSFRAPAKSNGKMR